MAWIADVVAKPLEWTHGGAVGSYFANAAVQWLATDGPVLDDEGLADLLAPF